MGSQLTLGRRALAAILIALQATGVGALPLMLSTAPAAAQNNCLCLSWGTGGICAEFAEDDCEDEGGGGSGSGALEKYIDSGTHGLGLTNKATATENFGKAFGELKLTGRVLMGMLRDLLYMVSVGAAIYGGFKMLGQGGGQDRTFVARIGAVVIIGAGAGLVVGFLSGSMIPGEGTITGGNDDS